MKQKNSIKLILCCVLTALLLSGCGKKSVNSVESVQSRKPEGHLIGGSTDQVVDENDANFSAGELEPLDGTGAGFDADSMSDEQKWKYGRSTLPLLPVYFGFDSSSIDTRQFDNLNSSGQYLLENESPRLLLEGNCDERGTSDYNLALGELRALSVKKYLVNLGVDPEKVTTISYGSERPLFDGHDEDAYAGNRRVDLVLP